MFGYLSIYLSIYIYILKKGKKIVWQQRTLKIIIERERERAQRNWSLVVGKLTWHNFNKIKNKIKKTKTKTKQNKETST